MAAFAYLASCAVFGLAVAIYTRRLGPSLVVLTAGWTVALTFHWLVS